MSHFSRACALTILALAAVLAAPAHSAPNDYRFEIVTPVETSGRGSTVTVALVHTPSGRKVADAEVFRRETVLREKGAPRIDERHVALTPDQQGNYRLTTYYPLSDGTVLKLGARVPGETGTVRGTVPARASN